MCKPGSACCGCGATSSGVGVAVGLVVTAGVISLTASFITDVLTIVLVSVLAAAGIGSLLLTVLLRKTGPMAVRPFTLRLSAGRLPAIAAAVADRPVGGERRAPLALEAPREIDRAQQPPAAVWERANPGR